MTKIKQGDPPGHLRSVPVGASGAGAQLIFSHTSMTASWLVAVRLIFAGLIMTAIGLVRNPGQTKGLLTNRGDLGILIAFTFLGMLNSQFTYMKAVQTSNAPTATVIQYLQPVLIIVWFTLRNRAWPRRLDILSITIALVGTFFLVTGGHLNSLSLTPIALFWGVNVCAGGRHLHRLTPGPVKSLRHANRLRPRNADRGDLHEPSFGPYALTQYDGLRLGNPCLHRYIRNDPGLHPLF